MASDFCRLICEGKEKEAKVLLRGAGGDLTKVAGDRTTGWRALLKARAKGEEDCSALYWDTVDTCFGSRTLGSPSPLPGCVEASLTPTHSLDTLGQATLARILTVVAYNSPDSPYLPLIYPVAGLLLEGGLKEDEVHEMICLLVCPPSGLTYVTQSRAGWDTLRAALRPLARQYVAKGLVYLEVEWTVPVVDSLLEAWPWWLLQYLAPQHRARVLDCFLLEGHKVLFRSALALLKTFYKQVSDKKSARYSAAKERGLEAEFGCFCGNPGLHPEELLSRAFKFPRFSKADISKLTARLEVEARSRKLIRGQAGRRSVGGGGTPEIGLKAVGETLAVKQGLTTPQPKPRGAGKVFPIHSLQSTILSKDQLQELWGLLPDRIATITPNLAYSTDEHGTSLTTFYTRVETWEPSFIVVRNTEQEIFGAYCSTSWKERNQIDDKGMRRTYFGTGECFLFRFTSTGLDYFPWVQPDSDDEDDPEVSGRARELFMSGDNTMITVGGGGGTGLYLDADLRFGRTESCHTFQNSTLCNSSDFTVGVIEVFGFNDISW